MVGFVMDYGLIGERLSHSFSKTIHEAIFDYNYELCEINREDLDLFLTKAEFKAINVTIPYKQDVIPYLYEIDDVAKKIGAVNTIVNKNGKLYGYNTDFLGLKALILRENISLKDKKVLILGSGGTSKTAFAVAEDLGAKEIYRVSRSKADGLIDYNQAYSEHSDAQIIINTTPCGMYPDIGVTPINLENFKSLSGVVDVVYNPLNTELICKAHKMGIKCCGGLFMLVSQAVFAAEMFTGKKAEEKTAEKIYKSLLLDKKNLVLIGMPSCGKSTIGKAVAKILGKQFFDSDEEIVKDAKMTIPEVFENYGEEYFRTLESEIIAQLSAKQGIVIATGGGAVLNKRNIELLRQNGLIVFLDRPLEQLITTDDRPLSKNREMLKKRYNERYSLYCESADIRIETVEDLEHNINAVQEVFLNENLGN